MPVASMLVIDWGVNQLLECIFDVARWYAARPHHKPPPELLFDLETIVTQYAEANDEAALRAAAFLALWPALADVDREAFRDRAVEVAADWPA